MNAPLSEGNWVEGNLVDFVLVSRIREIYDPFSVLGLGAIQGENLPVKVKDFTSRTPSHFVPMGSRRTRKYHLDRIAHFVQIFLTGGMCAPLEMDNQCDGGHIYPELVVEDGHHRLCAAMLVGLSRIPIGYSGRVDLLQWLKGKRASFPT